MTRKGHLVGIFFAGQAKKHSTSGTPLTKKLAAGLSHYKILVTVDELPDDVEVARVDGRLSEPTKQDLAPIGHG